MKKKLLYIFSVSCILASCQDTENLFNPFSQQDGELINVGGVTVNDEMKVTTRATGDDTKGDPEAAEKQEWLITPLKQGLDITYGKVGEPATERVAILKLLDTTTDGYELAGPSNNQYAVDSESKWASYSFKYRVSEGEGDIAWWHGNGAHYFEGQYVPQQLRYGAGTGDASSNTTTVNTTKAPGLHSNQTNKLSAGITTGNYELLRQYLGMPASTRLSATVARIKLPFRHRLCRVLAYVLIDPSFGDGVTLEGYMKSDAEKSSKIDDPETTELHFSYVDVLAGVKDEKDGTGHHTLTPQWMTARKVIPHFEGERGSWDKAGKQIDPDFIVYMDIDKETYTFPTDDNWVTKKNTYATSLAANGNDIEKTEKACKIRKINYGKVPVYDIIARPTYTTIDKVMYDEDGVKDNAGAEDLDKKREYLGKTNKIDFDITLSNGLQYSKEFRFDLDANYQTVVYLRISPESVDYNSSGSELWINTQTHDNWYGVDNENGNSLSKAGSSWQRAFTYDSTVDGDVVTDGGFYNENTIGEDGTAGQYLSAATWKKYFAQAYEGGEHHGDYFILTNNITIDASEVPANFVFTGHLDSNGKTITFTGGGSDVYEETIKYRLYPETDLFVYDGSSYTKYIHPSELYICKEIAQAKPIIRKGSSAGDDNTIPGGDDMMEKVNPTPTLAEVMSNDTKYYIKNGDGTYTLYVRPTKLYTHRKGANSLFCGLNGIYTTNQETVPDPFAQGVKWEANVHKEKNDKGTLKEYWVPYKGKASGWRAEVINTKVRGTMFSSDAEITGNVQNCYDGASANTKIENRTPEYPIYK